MIKKIIFFIISKTAIIYKLYNNYYMQHIDINPDPDFLGFVCNIDNKYYIIEKNDILLLYLQNNQYYINDLICDEMKEIEYSKLN